MKALHVTEYLNSIRLDVCKTESQLQHSNCSTLCLALYINLDFKQLSDMWFALLYNSTGQYHGSLMQATSPNVNTTEDCSCLKESVSSDKIKVDNKEEMNMCELCEEEPINIRFHPCQHAVICELCAERATKCIKCKVIRVSDCLYNQLIEFAFLCRVQLSQRKNVFNSRGSNDITVVYCS